MKSRVHPKYRTKYRVGNWAEYDRALVQRGDITLWTTTDAWKPEPSGKRGGQRKFSDHAIETVLILRPVFKLPLRQAEGFLRSMLVSMDVDLEASDHTTLSRRSQRLNIQLASITTGRPLHLIVAEALTDGNADDAKTALSLIDQVEGHIASLTADSAYDTVAIDEAAAARRAKVIVSPVKTATRSCRRRSRSSARDCTLMRVKEIGRRQWKKESGYHRLARVEDKFFRYKTAIGDRLHSRHPKSRETEVLLACSILDRMTTLGRPESFAIGA